MPTVKTPNYVTTEEITLHSANGQASKVVEAGSFVKPVEYCYLPSHIKESTEGRRLNEELDVFCYCKCGFIVIPRNKLVQK
jgi:hypothetical protein